MTMTSPFPAGIQPDLERAVRILKSAGCSAIFVFGSVTDGTFTSTSDLDLAVRGCPPPTFFPVLGQLMLELDHAVDLVDLDELSLFGQHLQQHGRLVQIG